MQGVASVSGCWCDTAPTDYCELTSNTCNIHHVIRLSRPCPQSIAYYMIKPYVEQSGWKSNRVNALPFIILTLMVKLDVPFRRRLQQQENKMAFVLLSIFACLAAMCSVCEYISFLTVSYHCIFHSFLIFTFCVLMS